jgi:hypothetical protein
MPAVKRQLRPTALLPLLLRRVPAKLRSGFDDAELTVIALVATFPSFVTFRRRERYSRELLEVFDKAYARQPDSVLQLMTHLRNHEKSWLETAEGKSTRYHVLREFRRLLLSKGIVPKIKFNGRTVEMTTEDLKRDLQDKEIAQQLNVPTESVKKARQKLS